MPKANTIQDLINNLNIKGPDECWLYVGHLTSHNKYGHTQMHIKRVVKDIHVWSYEHFVGPVPESLCVCHTCDVPRCCNPNHLWLGTRQENTADMKAKGRAHKPVGELNPKSKLTKEDVIKIRELFKAKQYTQAKLAVMFNVTRANICDIVHNKIWIHELTSNDEA